MGVVFGEAHVTRFSYLEYQAIMLCLAGVICLGLLAVELTMNRFQVLPLLFPGMFSIRERRFYFFDHLVSNVNEAGRLRSQAKMLVKMTLCVVLSYLWQHCVMDTSQQVGTDFPSKECGEKMDCFASELHVMTLLRHRYTPVDCDGPREDFPRRVVVSCIRFVEPSAAKWLMHTAIAHAVTQLNLKVYEMLVWIGGNSNVMRHLLSFMIFVSLAVCLGLLFTGMIREIASSWLSFVALLSVPVLLHNVYKSAKILENLWKEESTRVQHSIEEHLSSVFSDFEPPEVEQQEDNTMSRAQLFSNRARSLLKLTVLPSMISRQRGRGNRGGSTSSASSNAPRIAAPSSVEQSAELGESSRASSLSVGSRELAPQQQNL